MMKKPYYYALGIIVFSIGVYVVKDMRTDLPHGRCQKTDFASQAMKFEQQDFPNIKRIYIDRTDVDCYRMPVAYLDMKFTLDSSGTTFERALQSMQFHTGVSYAYNNSTFPYEDTIPIKEDTITIKEMLSILEKEYGIRYYVTGHFLSFAKTREKTLQKTSNSSLPKGQRTPVS